MAMELARRVYGLTESFPKSEQYGLCDQLRRAAVSVPSNIAEGCGRDTEKDYARFLSQALGSLYEVETQLELAGQLGYAQGEELAELMAVAENVGKRLGALARKHRGERS